MPGGEGLGFWLWMSCRKASGCFTKLAASPLPEGPVAGQFLALGVFVNLLFKDGELSFQKKSR